MRISNLISAETQDLKNLWTALSKAGVKAHLTTTELAMILDVSQDTVKRRLNRERTRHDIVKGYRPPRFSWNADALPEPVNDDWMARRAEWDFVTVIQWLERRPLRRKT